MRKSGLLSAMLIAAASFTGNLHAAATAGLRPIGVATVDITPDGPIRLSGYGLRKTESTGVAQRLYAKALALGSDREGPAVLITVDATGIPLTLRDEVVRRLQQLLREFGQLQRPGVGAYADGREGFRPPPDWVVRP